MQARKFRRVLEENLGDLHRVGGGQGLFGGVKSHVDWIDWAPRRSPAWSRGLLSLFGGGLLGRLCRGYLILNRAARCLGSEPGIAPEGSRGRDRLRTRRSTLQSQDN